MKFKDLVFEPKGDMGDRGDMGVIARTTFDNNYGASIIKGPYTYGGNRGLYELAVLKDDKLCYDTPITNDVKGYLTKKDVTQLLNQIEALKG